MSLADHEPEDKEPAQKWQVDLGSDGGPFTTGPMREQLAGDWSPILRHFNLDPDVFEVVDDTVRMSSWQQSKRTDDGDRDQVWMFAYRGQFRRKTDIIKELSAELKAEIATWRPTRKPSTKATDKPPNTAVICWADWQLGKGAGDGVEGTTERILNSFDATIHWLKRQRRAGHHIERVVIAQMGDPTEGCDGNYDQQLFTVQLNQREQLSLALRLMAQGVRQIAAHAERVEFLSVICNHGQWMRRNKSKGNVTEDADNVSGFLGDILEMVLTDLDHVTWNTPQGNINTVTDLSGVFASFTHGDKIPTKEDDWLRGQSIRLLRDHGREPRLWVTAHRHHGSIVDHGPWWRLQCPSLDGGSKWYEDTAGKWSTTGTLVFLAGEHHERGWSEVGFI